MMRFILPILFVIVAVGLFFGYVDPVYDEVKVLRAEEARFIDALDRSKELQQLKDQLLARYNTFSSVDLERLQKLLPDNVDNVRLVLDLDGIASNYGLQIRNVSIDRGAASVPGTISSDTKSYSSIVLSFAVQATYSDFLLFIQDLETSLRLVDIFSIEFSEPVTDRYDFQVSIRTYWLP